MITPVRRIAFLCAALVLGCISLVAAQNGPLLLGAAHTANGIIVVGERGTVMRSVDAGETWSAIGTPATATLTAVSFAPDGQHGWAVGHDAVVLATNDAGATWHIAWRGENLEDSFLDVCAVNENTIIAVGAYGFAEKSVDGGATWRRLHVQDDDSHLNRITRNAQGVLYIAGERGTLLRSNDQGDTWESIASPYDGSFYGILPLSSGSLLAYGLRGHIYRSDDAGENWQEIESNSHALLAAACQLHSGEIVLAGQSRTLLVSKDSGTSFTASPQRLTTAIAFLIEVQDGVVLALGEAGATRLPQR